MDIEIGVQCCVHIFLFSCVFSYVFYATHTKHVYWCFVSMKTSASSTASESMIHCQSRFTHTHLFNPEAFVILSRTKNMARKCDKLGCNAVFKFPSGLWRHKQAVHDMSLTNVWTVNKYSLHDRVYLHIDHLKFVFYLKLNLSITNVWIAENHSVVHTVWRNTVHSKFVSNLKEWFQQNIYVKSRVVKQFTNICLVSISISTRFTKI